MPPIGPFHAYKSYRFIRPRKTHWTKATCAEIGCLQYLNGWRVRIDSLTEQDIHVLQHCGRKYTVLHVSEHENYYVYEAGQPCFKANKHLKEVGREPIYLTQQGDYRKYFGSAYRHTNIEYWMEDFNEHQELLKKRLGID